LAKNLVYYNYIIGVCCGNCGKISASNFGGPSPVKRSRKQFSTVRGFQLCDIIANISGLEQDIVDGKMTLQTAITPIHAYQIW